MVCVSHTGAARKAVEHSPTRLEAVLEVLRQEGPLSGAALARAVGVTRQSLHPVLVTLRARGQVGFIRKGRHSLYSADLHREAKSHLVGKNAAHGAEESK